MKAAREGVEIGRLCSGWPPHPPASAARILRACILDWLQVRRDGLPGLGGLRCQAGF